MGTACACTTPTGAKGEVMTFTRASSGTCLKGGTTTGIANGDMVTCSTDQPRVMPGGDGTGGLGLLVEGERTNRLLRSQEFDNAAWANDVFGAGAITVTADQAVAPDGTTTADRWQIPAATSAQYTLRGQTGLSSATSSFQVFIKGNGESGTFYVLLQGQCAVCSYVSTSWTRCLKENVAAVTQVFLGSDPLDCGGGNQGTKDVFVWGGDVEAGAYVTSYIATTSAAVTRAAESGGAFTIAADTVNTAGSSAATFVLNSAALTSGGLLDFGPNNRVLFMSSSGGDHRAASYDSTNVVITAPGSNMGSPHRFSSSWSGTTLDVANATDGLTASGTFDTSMQSGTTLTLGYNFGGAEWIWGVIKRVCLDPSPTRCP